MDVRIPYTRTLVHERCKKEVEAEFDKELEGLETAFENGDSLIKKRASGNLVCTGAKREQNVHDAVHKLHRMLEEQQLIFYE